MLLCIQLLPRDWLMNGLVYRPKMGLLYQYLHGLVVPAVRPVFVVATAMQHLQGSVGVVGLRSTGIVQTHQAQTPLHRIQRVPVCGIWGGPKTKGDLCTCDRFEQRSPFRRMSHLQFLCTLNKVRRQRLLDVDDNEHPRKNAENVLMF